jgi:hypothetical protein
MNQCVYLAVNLKLASLKNPFQNLITSIYLLDLPECCVSVSSVIEAHWLDQVLLLGLYAHELHWCCMTIRRGLRLHGLRLCLGRKLKCSVWFCVRCRCTQLLIPQAPISTSVMLGMCAFMCWVCGLQAMQTAATSHYAAANQPLHSADRNQTWLLHFNQRVLFTDFCVA